MSVTVWDETGRRLTLVETGKAGGEGAIYTVEQNPAWAAKVYHPQRADAEQHQKVRAMVAAPPVDPAWEARRHRSIAWPTHLLYRDEARTRFAGFTMPAIDTTVFRESHAYFDPDDRVRRFGGGYTWRHLLTAACNLASSVAAVHAEGHRVGDLRETNVLVAPSALICLIDCDSFQIRAPAGGRTHPTRVGSGEYLPRELQGVADLSAHDRTEADRFALGVLLFKFLMLGVHPFQARGKAVADLPTTEAKIARGLFPYVGRARVQPPAFAPPFDVLPPALRALFKRCFVEGHRHPKRRPGPDEWFAALRKESKRLKGCRTNEHHVFAHHLRRCPWCAITPDPFPAPGVRPGTQAVVRAAVPRPAPPSAPPQPKPRRSRPLRTAFAAVRRARMTKRRALAVLLAGGLIVGAASPLGHAQSPPVVRAIDTRASRSGPCPFDATSATEPPSWCRARWRIGGARHTERRSRMLFLWFRTHRELRVDYEVRFRSTDGRSCELPWVDNTTYEEQRPAVCLASCPERIELRTGARALTLTGAGGLGARAGPLRCDHTYTGWWSFDLGDARGSLELRHPGLEPVEMEV